MHKRVAERWWRLGVFAFLLAAVVSTGCDFPRDPKGTLDQVQNGTMRVGVAANDPWTRMEDGEASGVEVEFSGISPGVGGRGCLRARDGARAAGGGPPRRGRRGNRWVHRHFPWREGAAGITRPYLTTRFVV